MRTSCGCWRERAGVGPPGRTLGTGGSVLQRKRRPLLLGPHPHTHASASAAAAAAAADSARRLLCAAFTGRLVRLALLPPAVPLALPCPGLRVRFACEGPHQNSLKV